MAVFDSGLSYARDYWKNKYYLNYVYSELAFGLHIFLFDIVWMTVFSYPKRICWYTIYSFIICKYWYNIHVMCHILNPSINSLAIVYRKGHPNVQKWAIAHFCSFRIFLLSSFKLNFRPQMIGQNPKYVCILIGLWINSHLLFFLMIIVLSCFFTPFFSTLLYVLTQSDQLFFYRYNSPSLKNTSKALTYPNVNWNGFCGL